MLSISIFLPSTSHYLHYSMPKYKEVHPIQPPHIPLSSLLVVAVQYGFVVCAFKVMKGFSKRLLTYS